MNRQPPIPHIDIAQQFWDLREFIQTIGLVSTDEGECLELTFYIPEGVMNGNGGGMTWEQMRTYFKQMEIDFDWRPIPAFRFAAVEHILMGRYITVMLTAATTAEFKKRFNLQNQIEKNDQKEINDQGLIQGPR